MTGAAGRLAAVARHLGRPSIQVIALVVLTLATYASAFASGFVSDDLSSILAGRKIDSLANLPHLFLHDTMWNSVGDAFARATTVNTYRPLPIATFFLEHAIYGKHATGYHVGSVLLHAGNAILVWLLGRRLGLSTQAAWLAAAVFAVHPSTCEAVHWINGRSDPMSVLFVLAGLVLWLPWLRGARPGAGRVAAIALFALAASLCKETAFLLVPALAVLALSLLRAEGRRYGIAAAVALAAPWVGGLALGFTARTIVLGKLAAGSGAQVGHALARVPLIWRDGLLSLLVPSNSICASLFTRYREADVAAVAASSALAAALVAAGLWAYRGRRSLVLTWIVATFLLDKAPDSLLTSFEGWAGWGRYLYPATPMFALLLAELGVRWLRGRLLSRWLRVAATAAVLLMAMRTFAAGADFRSERAYSAALIEADPDSHIGYLQLGSLERFLGRPAQAIPLLEKAVSIDPRSTGGWSLLAWSNLAVGRLEDAHRAARTTLGLDPSDRIARFVLSVVLMRANRQEDAAAVFLPLLAEDSAEVGLWKEAFKAVARFGGDSPFVAALRRAVDDERFRHIRSRLQALLALQAPGTGQAPE